MGLFSKKKQAVETESDRLKKNLSKIQAGMSVEELKTLAGAPSFSMKGSVAFGLAGAVVGSIPQAEKDKERWIYKTPLGEFQVTVLYGRVINISGLDALLNK
jgi:hypothetical protein